MHSKYPGSRSRSKTAQDLSGLSGFPARFERFERFGRFGRFGRFFGSSEKDKKTQKDTSLRPGGATRYQRVVDAIDGEFKNQPN